MLTILAALHIVTFHCEGKYLSADMCICCSAISKLSMRDNKHYKLLICLNGLMCARLCESGSEVSLD